MNILEIKFNFHKILLGNLLEIEDFSYKSRISIGSLLIYNKC